MPYISQFSIVSFCWLIGGTLRIGTGSKYYFRKVKNRHKKVKNSAWHMPGSLPDALDRLFHPDYDPAPCGYDSHFTGDWTKAQWGEVHAWGYSARTPAESLCILPCFQSCPAGLADAGMSHKRVIIVPRRWEQLLGLGPLSMPGGPANMTLCVEKVGRHCVHHSMLLLVTFLKGSMWKVT